MLDIPYVSETGLVGVHYDLIVLGHPGRMLESIKNTKWDNLAAMCYGRLPNAEMPINIPGAKHFCTSEEIRAQYKDKFQFIVINQAVSQEWFDLSPCEGELKRVLWAHHNKNRPDYASLEIALRKRGVVLDKIGFPHSAEQGLIWPEDVRERYARAQMIVGFGRWAYQGMAAGRSVAVANRRIVGMITPENYNSMVHFNLTERCNKISARDWESVIEQWSPELGVSLQQIAYQQHHVTAVLNKFLTAVLT